MSVARIPFTIEEEGVLRQLGGWMLFIAIIHFIGALLSLAGGCFGFFTGGAVAAMFGSFSTSMGVGPILIAIVFLVVGVLSGLVLLVQGVLLIQARGSFLSVVQTDESDQAHLSAGLAKLKVFFGIEVAFIGLGLIGSLLRLGLSVVGAVS